MKKLLLGLTLSFLAHDLNAQPISIGNYNFGTLRTPEIHDYSRIYREIGNQLSSMQAAELPNKFRFNSNHCKTSLYNLVTEKEIYSNETTIQTTIYLDYSQNKIAIDASDGDLSIYGLGPFKTETDQNGYIEIHGILPNVGRFTIQQIADNGWVIMLFLRSEKMCTVKSYRAYMSGTSR